VTELRHLRRQVTHQQRLALLGNLAAGLAHEIRNPLSSLKGFATYFRERLAESAEDRQNAEIMVAEVERLNRVITRLLDLTRPEEPEATDLDFLALTRETAAIITPLALKAGVEVRLSSSRENLPLRGDSDQLKQALLNLFLNALEAMPDGGVLTVQVDEPEGWTARLIVEDTGMGIAAADLAHIFDPYFTTKAGGTGLGLAVVQKILVAHGGEIQVTSEPGKGSRFVIFLVPKQGNL
jgi:two-component system sensor histidine kinase HydH